MTIYAMDYYTVINNVEVGNIWGGPFDVKLYLSIYNEFIYLSEKQSGSLRGFEYWHHHVLAVEKKLALEK